ncbi:MAG: hypothetical protein ACKPJU_10940 [Dolichospermum sp.]
MNNHRLGALHFVNAPYKSGDRTWGIFYIVSSEEPIILTPRWVD